MDDVFDAAVKVTDFRLRGVTRVECFEDGESGVICDIDRPDNDLQVLSFRATRLPDFFRVELPLRPDPATGNMKGTMFTVGSFRPDDRAVCVFTESGLPVSEDAAADAIIESRKNIALVCKPDNGAPVGKKR